MADKDVSEQVKENVDALKAGETESGETTLSTVSTDQIQHSLEEKARADGWRPLEEWEGDPTDWRDARTFIDRGELLSKISQSNKENKELRKAFKSLQEHNLKASQAAYERALSEFKAQKVEALQNNEHDKVMALDDQIDVVKDDIAKVKAQVAAEAADVTPEVPQEFTDWVDKNSWYAQDGELKVFADDVGRAYAMSNKGKTPTEVLKYVTERVRKAYPEKFTNPNREKPSSVEGGSGRRTTGASQSSADKYEMSEQEEKVFKTLHAQDPKFWTREKYVADLKGVTLR